MKKEAKPVDPAFVGVSEEFIPESDPEKLAEKAETESLRKKGLIAGIGLRYSLVILACLVSLSIFVLMAFNMLDRIADRHRDLTSSAESYNEFDKKSYNNQFESLDGEQFGGKVSTLLDRIAANNLTESYSVITVHFETSTDKPEDILAMKSKLDPDTEYSVLLSYNEEGFVSGVNISK